MGQFSTNYVHVSEVVKVLHPLNIKYVISETLGPMPNVMAALQNNAKPVEIS